MPKVGSSERECVARVSDFVCHGRVRALDEGTRGPEREELERKPGERGDGRMFHEGDLEVACAENAAFTLGQLARPGRDVRSEVGTRDDARRSGLVEDEKGPSPRTPGADTRGAALA